MEYIVGFLLALLMLRKPVEFRLTVKHEIDKTENQMVDLSKELANNSPSANLDETYNKDLTDMLKNLNNIMLGGDINGKE